MTDPSPRRVDGLTQVRMPDGSLVVRNETKEPVAVVAHANLRLTWNGSSKQSVLGRGQSIQVHPGGSLTILAGAIGDLGDFEKTVNVPGPAIRSEKPLSPLPPAGAEKLLLSLLPPSLLEPLIGDLEEWFQLVVKKHGLRFGRRWYWRQAAGAVFHLLGRRVAKMASVGVVLKLGRRLLGG